MKLSSLVQVVFICLFFGCLAQAQGVGASGDITGTVTDPSNAVVANATITVTNAERGIKRTDTTDALGVYRFPGVQPGAYSVTVVKTGSQTEEAKGVVVVIGQTTLMDFQMKVSPATETIEVTAMTPLIETEKGHQANVIGLCGRCHGSSARRGVERPEGFARSCESFLRPGDSTERYMHHQLAPEELLAAAQAGDASR